MMLMNLVALIQAMDDKVTRRLHRPPRLIAEGVFDHPNITEQTFRLWTLDLGLWTSDSYTSARFKRYARAHSFNR
jgi:hypothetical protein